MLKKVLFVCFMLLIFHSTYAIKNYKVSDTLYVWAKSGLFLRSEPNSKSDKLIKLNYGYNVIVLEQQIKQNPFEIEEFKGFKIKGYWIKVSFDNQIGYVFDGYLSKLRPLKKFNQRSEDWEDINTYTAREFKVLKSWSKNISNSIDNRVDSFLINYKNGSRYGAEIGDYGRNESILFKHISLEEGYLFAHTYFNWTKETFKIISIQDNKIICDFKLIEQTGGGHDITIEKTKEGINLSFGFSAP